MCKEQRCYNTGQGSGLVGKCLLHKQKDLSSDPSTHIKSQAQSRVLAVCYWRWARERVSWACQSASLMKLVSSELCKRSCLKEKNEVESSQRRHPMLTSDPHMHPHIHVYGDTRWQSSNWDRPSATWSTRVKRQWGQEGSKERWKEQVFSIQPCHPALPTQGDDGGVVRKK